MSKFIEKLPETKTHKNVGMTWEPSERPGEGMLTVEMGRTARTVYHIREMETPWEGRAFKLDIIKGGTDPESESYYVFAAINGQDHHCDCKGFAYGRGKPCKHLSAIIDGLLYNRWI